MRTIEINEYTKVEITSENIVTYYELMGSRWVALGNGERWSQELIDETF